MFNLTECSTLEEAEKVLDNLTFEFSKNEGNGNTFTAYCVEDPSFMAVHEDPEVALQMVISEVDMAVLHFIGLDTFMWMQGEVVVS